MTTNVSGPNPRGSMDDERTSAAAASERSESRAAPSAVAVVAPGNGVAVEQRLDRTGYRRRTIAKANQVIWYLTGIVEALIALRVGLKALGANPASDFTQIMQGLTQPLVWPFQGLFPSPGGEGFVLELSSLAALLVYFLLALALTRLTWIIYGEPKEIE